MYLLYFTTIENIFSCFIKINVTELLSSLKFKYKLKFQNRKELNIKNIFKLFKRMSSNSMDTSSPTSSKKIANATQSQIAQKTWEISNSIQGISI